MRWSENKTKRREGAATFFHSATAIAWGALVCAFAACAMAQPSNTAIKITTTSSRIPAEHATHTPRRNAGRHAVGTHAQETPKTASDVAAQLPRITLRDGTLTVNADNADLSAILNGVAQASGMKVDGNAGNARVFGVYGPGNPRQVLTELLDGVGYNFMMVGGAADGTPSELLLTAKSGAPPAKASAAQTASVSGNDDADQNEDDQEPAGPGAVMHVPPSVAQQADDSQTQQRVQQNLQRLQQMHNAMEQQQQNQPQ
jgi:hypothetical protein